MIFFNRFFDKNRLKALIFWSLTKSGEKTTIDLVEKLKDLGFSYAKQAGLSLGIDDLKIPPNKSNLILEAEITVQSSQRDFEIGNVTSVEKFQQLIDIWHRTSEILKQNVIDHFRSTDILNPVYMMAFSGARGNISQVRQLVGMRGLMADPQGQILDFPIRSNFREGLTLTEYVISCYGARKGLVDTALRTANSGYLTRRLIDVAQHIIVRQLDCGTKNGIIINDMKDGKKIIFPLQKRLIGRVLAESIGDFVKRNQDISPKLALKIVKLKNQVVVRSPLTCEAKNSICQLCYGWSLAHGSLVSLGEAVGILAAQSIGEPGTQLTMRTFHTGGVFSGDVMQEIRSPVSGLVSFSHPLQGVLIRTLHGKIAFLTKLEGELTILTNSPSKTKNFKYTIPSSTVLFIRNFEKVKERQLLAEYSSVVTTSNQGIQAKYNLNSNSEGQIYFENVLLVVKSGKESDIIKTALKFGSLWILSGKLYQSPIRSHLFVKSNDLVDINTILNESCLITPYTGVLQKYSTEKNSYKFSLKEKHSEFYNKEFLNTLIFDKQISIKKQFLLSNKRKKVFSENIFYINKNFNQIYFKNIKYKKFGYYISLTNEKENTIFLPNSLTKKNISFKNIYFQWFSNKISTNNLFTIIDKNFFSEQQGQVFLRSKFLYKVKENEIINFFPFSLNLKIEKNSSLFSLKNKQGNKLHIYSKTSGLIKTKNNFVKNSKFSSLNFEQIILKNYKKNPTKNLLRTIKEKNSFINKNEFFNFLSIPNIYQLNKKKIRKNNFKIAQSNIQNKEKKIWAERQLFFDEFLFEKKNLLRKEKKYFFFEIKNQWLFLPKTSSAIFLKNKNFLTPTYKTNTFHFDQSYIYKESNSLNKVFYFFRKTNYYKKIRYIKNKFFRYNRLLNKKTYFYQNKINLKQKVSIDFLEDTNNGIFTSIKKYSVNFKIQRNQIYSRNFVLTNFQIIEIEKINEIQLVNELNEKKKFQKLITNSRKIELFEITSFLFNKQKTTQLLLPYPNLDIKIQRNSFFGQEKNKNFYLKPFFVSFLASKESIRKQAKITLTFGKVLNFSTSQKVEQIKFLISEPNNNDEKNNKFFVTKNNYVLEKNIFTLNSFFSPFQGEITTIKTNLIGKEKSLLLTNTDKISFLNNQTHSLVKIGQLLRYGDEIFSNTGVTKSGQIIQIDKQKITLRKAQPILFSSQGVFHIDNNDIIEKNTPLITLFYQKLKTEDIVQGIPKIEELFEARHTKEGEALQENLHLKLHSYFTTFKQHYTSQEAARKSIEKIQQILVNNVQKVYQSQGVSIADKHIEIIVRQMTTKVKITESGRTGLLRGELIDLEWVELINLGIEAQNEMTHQGIEVEKAEYEPIILGITKAALETESFISASSFQETTRILSRAAIERKTDFLRGLKENVILGHLIPAGTGFSLSFDSQLKLTNTFQRISWLSYKDVITTFSKIRKI